MFNTAKILRLSLVASLKVAFLMNALVSQAQQLSEPFIDSFTLVDADTGQTLVVYPNTADVNRVSLPLAQARDISFRFDTSNTSSVRISGVSPQSRLENQQPFSLLGDDGATYESWSPSPGVYTIVVQPFSQANVSGQQGQSATLSLTVTDDAQTLDELEPTPPQPATPFSAVSIIPITTLLLLSDDGGSSETGYTLNRSMVTSAGVFDAQGRLLRTLWSNRRQASGNHPTPEWDGLDDQGRNVLDQGDEITVIANDIQVEWEGTVGNTSDTFATEDVHRQFQFYHDMIITGNDAYFSMDYAENWGSSVRVDLENPQKRVSVMPTFLFQQSTDRLASDGERLYMAGRQPFDLDVSYVQAAEISNLNNFRNYLPFQGSVLQILGDFFRAGDVVTDDRPDVVHEEGRARVTGLAVQQSGDWLFVARQELDSLRVVHKITGELSQEYTFDEPKLTKIDRDGNLWMVHNETVEKFTINDATGAITSTGFDIDGFTNIQGMDISPNGNTVAIADAAATHRVFGHSTSTGARQWTLGRNESYSINSTVYNDKFLFRSKHEDLHPVIVGGSQRLNVPSADRLGFVAYESDGSFWVGDRGNNRSLKFSSNRVYQDQIMWQPGFYNAHVDRNNPSRVFADYLEFDVDYALPLEPGNGNQAWRLANNWSEGIELGRDYFFSDRLENVTTLSNNRTYFLAINTSFEQASSQLGIFELVDRGSIRYTGVSVDNPRGDTELKSDGRITWTNVSFVNGSARSVLHEQKIIGFNNAGNPLLGQAEVFATVDTENELFTNGAVLSSGEVTSSGDWLLFNGFTHNDTANPNNFVTLPSGQRAAPFYQGAHLGGVKRGENRLSFATAEALELQVGDPFPLNGEFDARRFGQTRGGNVALAYDDIIVWGYHGEFWESTQTNIWNMVSEEGLFLKQFGVADPDVFAHTVPGMAGNAFSPALVKVGSNMYLWHNDESYQGGLSRWKISNLSSIQRITLPLNN